MKRYSVVLGSFDGVHLGHKGVISLAKGINLKPAAVYFYIPPGANGAAKELITTNATRKALFAQLGVKETLCLDFEEVRQLSPQAFFRLVTERFNPVRICCGFNYRFGKNAAGDVDTLQQLCGSNGIELCVAPPVEVLGQTVSSTAIRGFIAKGEIEKANQMLGRPFSFCGAVITGDGRGATLGFPTANVYYPAELIKPKAGVYVTNLVVGKRKYRAVTNLGERPTYPTENPPSESYVLDVNKNFYGKTVSVELLKYIRGSEKFESAQALADAIKKDAQTAYDYIEN